MKELWTVEKKSRYHDWNEASRIYKKDRIIIAYF